jgi:hypothetical protein
MLNDDVRWFKQLKLRQTRIRVPVPGEFSASWPATGDHDATRRRVLVWRVPKNNPGRKLIPDGLMRIPLLLRADESVENDDKVLLPILDWLMREAAMAQSQGPFVMTQEVGAFPGWSDG